jgi:hypothetical protein
MKKGEEGVSSGGAINEQSSLWKSLYYPGKVNNTSNDQTRALVFILSGNFN